MFSRFIWVFVYYQYFILFFKKNYGSRAREWTDRGHGGVCASRRGGSGSRKRASASPEKKFFLIKKIKKIMYLSALSLSCGTWDLRCVMWIVADEQTLWLWHAGSVVVVCGLCCPGARRILIHWPEIKPTSHALQGTCILSHWITNDDSIIFFRV